MKCEEIAFESEPGTLTDEKLHALHGLGVTRLSIGVENFDDEILRSNGRAHLSKEVYRAYEVSRAAGFQQINIDLIAGMLNETEANWKECVRKAIELGPECVTVYQMEVPFNTKIYKEMHEKGEIVAPVADWPTKRAWVDYAFSELEKAGYTITSGYTAIRNPSVNRFQYREYLWRGADMMALGVASFGHFRGTHYQNEKDFGPYVERTARGELPIARGMALSDDDRLIREFILLLKLGQVEAAYFQGKFGVDIFDRFAEPLAHHAAAGLPDARRRPRDAHAARAAAGRRVAARVLPPGTPQCPLHLMERVMESSPIARSGRNCAALSPATLRKRKGSTVRRSPPASRAAVTCSRPAARRRLGEWSLRVAITFWPCSASFTKPCPSRRRSRRRSSRPSRSRSRSAICWCTSAT